MPFDQIPLWQPGGIDFPGIMRALQEIGYDGYVTVHQASLGTPQDDAANSARYLRSLARFEPADKAVWRRDDAASGGMQCRRSSCCSAR